MTAKKKLAVVKPKRPPIETIVKNLLQVFLETDAQEVRIQLDTSDTKGIMVSFDKITKGTSEIE